MGLYNLLSIEITCAKCLKEYSGKLQFKVGELWLYEHQVGDSLKVNPDEGKLLSGREIVAYGILEDASCSFCGFANVDEYDIYIKDLKILKYDPMIDYSPYLSSAEEGFYYL